MRRMFFLMSFGIGAAMMGATQTQAQPTNCAERSAIVSRLAQHYGESRQSVGLNHDNTLVEVFASLDTGSWTIAITQPGGLTCLVAAGQAYQYLNEPLAQFDAEA